MTDATDMISRKAVLALPHRLSPSLDAADGYYVSADAIRALPSVGVTVKPLEWAGSVDTRLKADVYSVRPTYGQGGKDFLLARSGNVIGWFDDTRTAQAIAEADYAARILSAIDVHPTPAPSPDVAQSDLMQSGLGLKRIVEEIDGAMNHGTWRDDQGTRLKDTPEWVQFYNALAALGPVALAEKIQKALDVQPAPAPSPDTCADAQSRTDQETALSPDVEAQTFYIDCEFDGHNGPLLSIAMVAADGLSLHIHTDEVPVDPWVIQNVMPALHQHKADQAFFVGQNEVGEMLRAFIGDCQNPTIIADSPVDIGRFCRAISTGSDGGWASTGYQSMAFKVENVDCYPTDLVGAVQHNAWWDAMALRAALARKGGE